MLPRRCPRPLSQEREPPGPACCSGRSTPHGGIGRACRRAWVKATLLTSTRLQQVRGSRKIAKLSGTLQSSGFLLQHGGQHGAGTGAGFGWITGKKRKHSPEGRDVLGVASAAAGVRIVRGHPWHAWPVPLHPKNSSLICTPAHRVLSPPEGATAA